MLARESRKICEALNEKPSSGLRMSKRKKKPTVKAAKKQKLASEDSPESEDITSKETCSVSQTQELAWSESEALELLQKIEENIPTDDILSYASRLTKIKWENIQLKDRSSLECKEAWNGLCKKVRKFRLLRELLSDMRDLVNSKKTCIKIKPMPPIPISKANSKKTCIEKKPIQPIPVTSKPKQPFNSYMSFVEDNREEVTRKNPRANQTEIVKILGQMFRNLPLAERQKYDEIAKANRQEYLQKLEDLYKEHPEMIPKRKDRQRHRKDRQKQRDDPFEKPKTPFELFVKIETEKEGQTPSRSLIRQKCVEQWNGFTDKEKFFYINWAEELYAKYLEDVREYMKTHPYYEPEKIKFLLNKKEQNIKDRCSGKPEKPPHGPYNLFTKLLFQSEELRHIPPKDLPNYTSEKWRSCSSEERNVYKLRLVQMWEEYHKKLDIYVSTLPPEDRARVMEEEESKKYRKTDGKVASIKGGGEVTKLPKPQQPPETAYKYFAHVYKGDKKAQTLWSSMTEEQKDVFRGQLDEKRREYIVEYEKYLKSLSREELEKLGASLTSHGQDDSSDSEVGSEED